MYFGAGKMHRTGFINLFWAKRMHPSGAKAPFFLALDGMAKAMPLQSTTYETGSRSFAPPPQQRQKRPLPGTPAA